MRNLELAALPFAIWLVIIAVQRALGLWRGEPAPDPIEKEHLQQRLGGAALGFMLLAWWITWVNRPDF